VKLTSYATLEPSTMTYRHTFDELCHPLPLAAIAVLLVNDHLLKGAGLLPALVTGKLSDVAGLFFFPIFLFVVSRAIWQLVSGRAFPTRVMLWCAVGLTVAGFGALKVSAAFNTWAASWWGVAVMDPTDLLCLPVCLVAAIWVERRWHSPRETSVPLLAQYAVVLVAAAVSVATSPPPARNFPHWELQAPSSLEVGALELEAWGAKSGKEGLGVVLEAANSTGDAHTLQVDTARLELFRDDPSQVLTTVEARGVGEVFRVAPQGKERVYLPFVFDNEAAWNADIRHAHLVLEIRVDAAPVHTWRMPATHVFKKKFIPYGEAKKRESWREETDAE
jgi:hypothetical protein